MELIKMLETARLNAFSQFKCDEIVEAHDLRQGTFYVLKHEKIKEFEATPSMPKGAEILSGSTFYVLSANDLLDMGLDTDLIRPNHLLLLPLVLIVNYKSKTYTHLQTHLIEIANKDSAIKFIPLESLQYQQSNMISNLFGNKNKSQEPYYGSARDNLEYFKKYLDNIKINLKDLLRDKAIFFCDADLRYYSKSYKLTADTFNILRWMTSGEDLSMSIKDPISMTYTINGVKQ